MKGKRLLSIALTIILIISMFPLELLISNAATNSKEDEAVISQIKEAWGKMYLIKTQVPPRPYYGGFHDEICVSTPSDGYAGATKDMLGNKYATRKFAGDEIVLFEEGTKTGIVTYDDFYFYYKVEKDERGDKTATPSLDTQFAVSGVNTIGCKNNNVDTTSSEWVKLTKADIFSDVPSSMWRLYQNVKNATDVTLTFGSLMFIDYAKLPATTDGWTLADWITAAKDFLTDYPEYLGKEDLVKVLNDNDPDNKAIEAIKTAWSKMYIIKTQCAPRPHYGAFHDEICVSTPSDGYAGATKDMLGNKYVTRKFAGDEIVLYEEGTKTGIVTYDDFYFYYKVEKDERGEKTATPSLDTTYVVSSINTIGCKNNSVDTESSEWVKLTKADVFSEVPASMWRLYQNVNNAKDVTLTFGSLMFIDYAKLPTNTGEWKLADWITAAKDFLTDYPEYLGKEDLEKVIKENDPDNKAIEAIKTAWTKMYTVKTQCAPRPYYGGGFKDADCVSTPSDGYAGATKDMLGNKYVTRKFAGDEIVLYEEGTKTGIVTYDDFYFYYKVEKDERAEKTATPSLDTTYVVSSINTIGCKNNSVDTESSEWVKLTKADVFSEVPASMWRLYQNVNNAKDVTITFGSLIFIDYAKLPTETDGWTLTDWAAAAEDFLYSFADLYENTDELRTVVEGLDIGGSADAEKEMKRSIIAAWKNLATQTDVEWGFKQAGVTEQEYLYEATDKSALCKNAADTYPDDAGRYYTVSTFTNTTAFANNSAYGTCYLMAQKETSNIEGNSGKISFYIDSSEYVEGLTICSFFRATNQTGFSTGKAYVVKDTDVDHWVTLTEKDFMATGSVTVPNVGNSIIMCIYGTDADGVKMAFTDYTFEQKVQMPSESSNWSFIETFNNAKKVNTDKCVNVKPFNEALAAAEQFIIDNNIPTVIIEKLPEDITALGENLFDSMTLETNYFDGASRDAATISNCGNMTDMDLSTSTSFSTLTFGDDKYVDITYTAENIAAIDKLLFKGANIKEYRIYASQNYEKLYTDENLQFTISGKYYSNEQLLTPYEKIQETYVGIRIFGNGSTAPSIYELAAFGMFDDYIVEKGNYLEYTSGVIEAIGTNLLVGIEPKFKNSGLNMNNTTSYPFSNLTDCSMTNGYTVPSVNWNDGENDRVWVDFYYDLGESYKLNKFFLGHWYEDSLEDGAYEIYVSSTISELFLKESRVLSYDNRSNSKHGTTDAQLLTMPEGKEPVGRYVCFRIKCAFSDWEMANARYRGMLYIRICQLGAYGYKYERPAEPTNLTSHVPVKVYRSDAANHVAISQQELSNETIQKLYDKDYTTPISIATNGKKLDFVFNMCSSVNIDALKIFASSSQISDLKIYAADNEDEVWESASLVYSPTLTSSVDKVEKELSTPLTARFVRFSVVSSTSVFNPTEIEVVGLDNQQTRYRNLLADNSPAISVYSMNYSTGYFSPVSEFDNKFYSRPIYQKYNLTDTDVHTLFDIYAGKSGESSIDFVVDLGYLCSIDSLVYRAGSNKDHWPTNLQVYFGETESLAMSDTAVAKYSFTKKSEDGVYACSFVPQYARYIRFQIKESDHPYLKEHLLAVVSELEVMGMAVNGRETEDVGAVLSFTDKRTNVKVNIMKNDDNDVYSGVRNISVERIDATNADKEALMPYSLMVYGKKYVIKLLDKDGKKVTDIGGRKIQVFIPTVDGLALEDAYLASIENGEAYICKTTIYSDRIATTFENTNELNSVLLTGFVLDYPENYIVKETKEDKKPETETSKENKNDTPANQIQRLTVKDEESGISVSYVSSDLPNDVELYISSVSKSDIPKALLSRVGDSYSACRIQFKSQSGFVEPSDVVRVFMPVPEGLIADKCKVILISEDGSLSDMKAEITDGQISFLTDKSGVFFTTDQDLSGTLSRKVVKKIPGKAEDTFDWIWVIIGGGTLVLIGAALLVVLLLRKRKKQ